MNSSVLQETTAVPAGLAGRLHESRARATRWLLDHIDDDGTPVGVAARNGWARVPWALAMVGEREVGAAVLSWAERNALDNESDFREGPTRPQFAPVYPLAHLAYGAWLLERYDTALAIMRRLRMYQDPETGGVTPGRPSANPRQDVMCTAQLGVTALVMREGVVAEGVFRWLSRLFEAQPELPSRLYLVWEENQLVTEVDPDYAFMTVVDFTKEKQAYFNSGISTVFLAGYAMQNSDDRALELGRKFLQLNIDGTPRQFDHDSVQICKFGWGAAAMLEADRTNAYLSHVIRMAEWFMQRQAQDGSWAPSSFVVPEPDDIDKLVKTAEHLMELTVISTALGGRTSTG